MPNTPLSGLPYPTLTSPNNPPADLQALATTLDPLVSPQVQTYTPVWSQSGQTLAIGNGTLTGTYVKSGRMVQFSIYMLRGSTTNMGTAGYFWTLPVAAASNVSCVGNGVCSVGGAFKAVTALRLANSTTLAAMRSNDAPLANDTFSWAAGDWINLTGSYIAAS